MWMRQAHYYKVLCKHYQGVCYDTETCDVYCEDPITIDMISLWPLYILGLRQGTYLFLGANTIQFSDGDNICSAVYSVVGATVNAVAFGIMLTIVSRRSALTTMEMQNEAQIVEEKKIKMIKSRPKSTFLLKFRLKSNY